MIAIIIGHLIGSLLTVWNGRGGSVYHIGFPVWIRATFGPWGGLIPVGVRCILDMVWFGIQTYFGALFLDIVFQCIFGSSWTNLHNSLPESSGTTTRFVSATHCVLSTGWEMLTLDRWLRISCIGVSNSAPPSSGPTNFAGYSPSKP